VTITAKLHKLINGQWVVFTCQVRPGPLAFIDVRWAHKLAMLEEKDDEN
jgi:hypothetical protein